MAIASRTYQFPFIADERAVNTTLLERLGGILDLKSDQEVLMTYTSFNRDLDSALISAYAPDAQAIAVGSTFGSDSDPHFVPLNGEEFSRDLKVANHGPHDDTDGDTYDRIPRCRSPAISRVGRTLPVRRL
ncbi:MAG: hypothetical protein WCA27_21680 [Candidatus Sulfotelmatobacter sp.]